MRTYETNVGGTRTLLVRVQAKNIMDAKRLFEMQYGKGCVRYNIKEIRDTNTKLGGVDKGSPGFLAYLIVFIVLGFIGYLFAS